MGDSKIDAEANAFAMALLMPAEWLREDIEAMGGIDVDDVAKMTKLAKRYRVSVPILTLRIGQLSFHPST